MDYFWMTIEGFIIFGLGWFVGENMGWYRRSKYDQKRPSKEKAVDFLTTQYNAIYMRTLTIADAITQAIEFLKL